MKTMMSKFQTSPTFNNLMEDVAVSPTDVYMKTEHLTYPEGI